MLFSITKRSSQSLNAIWSRINTLNLIPVSELNTGVNMTFDWARRIQAKQTQVRFVLITITMMLLATPSLAQSGLEGRIVTTIGLLTRIANVLIAGFIVWAGLLIAKGESSGFQKLVYGIVGLIVVNAAYLIVNYFR